MKNKTTEDSIITEALDVLMKHMEPAKVAKFLAAWQQRDGQDSIAIKDRLFGKMTVDGLANEIRKFQAKTKKSKKNAA